MYYFPIANVKHGVVQRTGHLGSRKGPLIERTSNVGAPSVKPIEFPADLEDGHGRTISDDPYGMTLRWQICVLDPDGFGHRPPDRQ